MIVALDGRSGTGKSTIARLLAKKLNATVIKCDDFYAGGSASEWDNMTPKEKVDTCIDWKRLRSEVVEPLRLRKPASWRSFNWDRQEGLSDEVFTAMPTNLIILDGIYSGRPELSDLVDFSIYVTVPDDQRRIRLNEREGESRMRSWQKIWDEAEDYYFDVICLPERFDMVVTNQ